MKHYKSNWNKPAFVEDTFGESLVWKEISIVIKKSLIVLSHFSKFSPG